MNTLLDHHSIEIVVPMANEFSGSISSFRVKNMKSADVADSLMKDQGILTVARSLGTVGCIRVTPALYNSVEEMQKLVGALRNTQ